MAQADYVWADTPPKGTMFIWAKPNGSWKGWSVGLGYWTVSGTWRDAYGGDAPGAIRFTPMPEPPHE